MKPACNKRIFNEYWATLCHGSTPLANNNFSSMINRIRYSAVNYCHLIMRSVLFKIKGILQPQTCLTDITDKHCQFWVCKVFSLEACLTSLYLQVCRLCWKFGGRAEISSNMFDRVNVFQTTWTYNPRLKDIIAEITQWKHKKNYIKLCLLVWTHINARQTRL